VVFLQRNALRATDEQNQNTEQMTMQWSRKMVVTKRFITVYSVLSERMVITLQTWWWETWGRNRSWNNDKDLCHANNIFIIAERYDTNTSSRLKYAAQ